jgi:hypothetical protein
MPITRKQFELGIDNEEVAEAMRRIYDFLIAHKDEAFLKEELREFCGFSATKLRPNFEEALGRLAEGKIAEAKHIRDKTYYSYGANPLDL